MADHAKRECSVDSLNVSLGHQILLSNTDEIEQPTMHNFVLQGKPLEDLGSLASTITKMSMAGLSVINRPLVLISQDQEMDYSGQSPRGVASNTEYVNAQSHIRSE